MRKYIVCFCLAVSIFSVTAFAEFSSSDSDNLNSIENSLTNSSSSLTVAGMLYRILDQVEYLGNINNQINKLPEILGYDDAVSAYPSLYSLLYQNNELIYDIGSSLSSSASGSILYELQQIRIYQKYLTNTTTIGLWSLNESGNPVKGKEISSNILGWTSQIYSQLTWDGINPHTYDKTFYGLVAQMQRVLASDDDLALAESQEDNRNQIEDTFLSGESSGTSLGVGDFQNLNSVGSEVTDLFSLGGTASVDGFVSGFGDAESVGSGWFSAATQSQLDTVPTTFALGDPYNMAGWESNYEWVLGGDFE